MSTQQFRDLVKGYLRTTGYSQKALADALSLHQQVLSRKMSGIGPAQLNNVEIKKIVQTLAEWQGISTWSQAVELLACLDLKPAFFSIEEWESCPLRQLERTTFTAPVQPPTGLVAVGKSELSARLHFNNLPAQLTSLVGRELVIERVGWILNRPTTRLLSLVGPGGSGKTRLAVEVGRAFESHFSQGVCFVNLAEVSDPAWVGSVISQALGLLKSDTHDPLQNLKAFLQDQHLLLILDNFEQIVEAASLVEELLLAAPGLKIMVTTRVVLHLYGEQEFAVPTLDLPGPGEAVDSSNLHKYDAIRLFVERVRAVKPDFIITNENAWLVAEICSQLNGLPLALELAATRAKLLPLPILLERLTSQKLDLLSGGAKNLPARQKTLRNTLDWSYKLLDPAEQQLFRCLGIFRGSFSVEAVQAICSQAFSEQAAEVNLNLDRLGALLDNSLILQTQSDEPAYGFALPAANLVSSTRFKLLETIREYVLEQLSAQGELARLQRAKFQYYSQLTRNQREQLNGPDQDLWLNMLDAEYPNIRIALDTGLSLVEESSPAERTRIILDSLEMCRNLASYWDTRGYYVEGKIVTNHFLDAARQAELTGTEAYAWALSIAGIMTGRLGNFSQAQGLLEESLSLFVSLGEKPGEANTLNFLGTFAFLCGDYTQAQQLLLQAEEICLQAGDKQNLGKVLINLAILVKTLGNFTRADALLRQGLVIFQEQGNKRMIGACLHNLGAVAALQQDYATALIYYHECLQLHTEQAEYRSMAYTFRGLATIAYFQGAYPDANSHLVESLRLSYQIGDRYQIGLNLALMAILNVAKFELDLPENIPEERKHYLRAAARLMGGSEAQFKAVQAVIHPVYKSTYEEKAQKARSWLGEADFTANFVKGLTSPLLVLVKNF